MSDMSMIEHHIIAHTPSSLEATALAGQEMIAFAAQQSRKTLVLDLDETLVHSSFQKPEWFDYEVPIVFNDTTYTIFVQKRPGVDQFLEQVAFMFDLYIFTASMPEYSLPVIQLLWPGFPISRVLTRHHCRVYNGFFVKDLSIFQRNMKDIIIVDNNSLSYQFQYENGIQVTTWIGNAEDEELLNALLPLLQQCQISDDVRIVLGSHNQ